MASYQKDDRFFTKDWTITIPSRSEPTLEFRRLTPAQSEEFVKFAADAPLPIKPTKNEDPPSTTQAPFPSVPGERMRKMYAESRTRHHALDVYMTLEGRFVGYGGVYEITAAGEKPSIANIGIRLSPEVRGKGLGRLLMQVVLRLSNELDVEEIEAGTMHYNTSMRALAKSIGIAETDEVKDIPGRGVVADVMFKQIAKEKWKDFAILVKFRDQAASA